MNLKELQSLLPSNAVVSAVFENMSNGHWGTLYPLACKQGLSAIVWNNILQAKSDSNTPLEYQPTKSQKIQWALAIENSIKSYNRRKQISIEIADIWAKENLKTYGLKGLALSTYYPKPELRECGDFDCYLGTDFERGNQLAIANGAKFDPHDYRHSHIYYKGLTIENHRYFLPVRGNARNKRLEQYLVEVIPCDRRIEDSNVYYPSPQFHALFIVLHMLQHFLYENITLRHMLDWTYFVNAEKTNIDWREFNTKCEEAGVTRFVEALNHICSQHMGLNLDGTLLKSNDRYADKILRDTLEQSSHHISSINNLWHQRFAKIENIISQRWKFNEVYDTGAIQSIIKSIWGIMLNK